MRTSIAALGFLCVMRAGAAWATPSTTFWTPCTPDIQAPHVWHLGIDNYFTVGNGGADGEGDSFPTDVGLTYGLRLSHKLPAEVGVDILGPTDDPTFFNAKFGYVEDALRPGAPAVQLGVFNVGTRSGVTDQNIFDLIIGKSLPRDMGRVSVAYYHGKDRVLRSSTGAHQASGFMIGYDRWLLPGRFMLAADYASGKNAIGGGGFGIYYYFNRNASLLIGPVWFNDRGINGTIKWTTQIDINF